MSDKFNTGDLVEISVKAPYIEHRGKIGKIVRKQFFSDDRWVVDLGSDKTIGINVKWLELVFTI